MLLAEEYMSCRVFVSRTASAHNIILWLQLVSEANSEHVEHLGEINEEK